MSHTRSHYGQSASIAIVQPAILTTPLSRLK